MLETVTVPKLDHVPVSKVTKEPTCGETGVETITCNVCKQVIETRTLPKKTTHTPVTVTEREATCAKKGLIVEKCSVCGAVLKQTETKTIGHKFVAGTVTAPAEVSTFTWNGSEGTMYGWRASQCSVCGARNNNEKYTRLKISGSWEPVFDSRTNLTKGTVVFRFKDAGAYDKVKQVVYSYGDHNELTEVSAVNGAYSFTLPAGAAETDPIYIFVVSK